MDNKKTDRKNRTNLVVKWPSNIFTIKELHSQNSNFIMITLRVRVKNAIMQGQVVEVGDLNDSKGRPKLMLAVAPLTEDHIEEAKSRKVTLRSNLSVNVMEVKKPSDMNNHLDTTITIPISDEKTVSK